MIMHSCRKSAMVQLCLLGSKGSDKRPILISLGSINIRKWREFRRSYRSCWKRHTHIFFVSEYIELYNCPECYFLLHKAKTALFYLLVQIQWNVCIPAIKVEKTNFLFFFIVLTSVFDLFPRTLYQKRILSRLVGGSCHLAKAEFHEWYFLSFSQGNRST